MIDPIDDMLEKAKLHAKTNAIIYQATDDLEATTDRTNTKLSSELAQGSTNPKDDLDEIIPCTTGCGSNADPADGFGRCTCGGEQKRQEVQEYVTLARIEDNKAWLRLYEGANDGLVSGIKLSAIIDRFKNHIAALQRDSQPEQTFQDIASMEGYSPSQPGGTA